MAEADSQPDAKAIEASAAALAQKLSAARLHHPFFVPILSHRWEECESLNAELEAAILARAGGTAGIRRSNVGGWHSEPGCSNGRASPDAA